MPTGIYKRNKCSKIRVLCNECEKIQYKFPCYVKDRTHNFCCRKCKHTYDSKNLNGKNNPSWKGGRIKVIGGYIRVSAPKHPNCDSMGYVLEHRLLIEKKIGRYLTSKEIIHHINGNTSDNKIENLQIVTRAEHNRIHKELNLMIEKYG